MQLVDNDTFLKQLAALFESSKDHGSIWLTHKRLAYDGEDSVMVPADDSKEYPCLVRVTNGKDIKLSTHVLSNQLDKFLSAYGTTLKASMTTLRKRDKKREKQRAEQQAARKRRLTEPIIIEGSKRGNGRRKRERRVNAVLKQEEARRHAQEHEAEKAKATA
ncbi:signal recognition particle, SRP9/SRP14 subunit [Auriscalpium vulgare]|uniref:Signal recognition particle, SRP9/SRP14 subunit n=1 Tax=Auriscalpium vulgare TaxID=40419 RepID=A0ACB8SBX2_9AGAM|nr:signal recognition particle, SRP9/SRP14 subunit [Auriscalpium vulgare]